MALYKNPLIVKKVEDKIFDETSKPGTPAPRAGIFRCTNCGHEIGIAQGKDLPPQNHYQHAANSGAIEWQLVVYAQHKQ